jgi:plasmid stability protein
MQLEILTMAMLTVRNLPDEVHRALRVRAAKHGNSMEAEVRDILAAVVSPQGSIKLGSMLADIGQQLALSTEEHELFHQLRDKTPARAVSFE